MEFIKKILPKSSFARGVGVLAGGTAISQFIAIAILPLLTRLYTPEDFSVLAVYAAILAIISVVSCLRFEIAIPIPKKNIQAKELLTLSLVSVLFTTFLTTFFIFFFSELIHSMTKEKLRGFLWLLPIGVLLSGLYAALQFWFTREKDFVLISKTRMSQAVSGAGTQLGLGFVGLNPLGLLLGQVLNVGAGVIGLARRFFKTNSAVREEISLSGIKRTLTEYQKFPKYSMLEALANSASIQVPILLIAWYTSGPDVGFIMLATRLLSAPMGLLGRSVAQVYLSEAPAYYQSGELKQFTGQTIWNLSKIGGLSLFIVGISAPYLVPFIFGDEWARAGILITWMTPWFFLQFITSPISMSLHITGNQKVALFLQLLGLLLRCGGVWLSGMYLLNYIVEIYVILGVVFYFIYLLVVLAIISKGRS